jgi:hypothetical protein
VCAYALYPVKVWCNGHEIARRAALAEGIAVTPLANGFAATSDAGRLQELCDMIQAGTLRVFFEHWMSRLPLPLTAADRDHDCWWQLSMILPRLYVAEPEAVVNHPPPLHRPLPRASGREAAGERRRNGRSV